MPVFIRFDGVDGGVRSGGASGGVWKTTNFLTTNPVGATWSRTGGGALQNLCGANTWAANAVPVSRISLTPGGGGVEGRDPAAKLKVEQLIHSARSKGPVGTLYVETNAGVYQNGGSRPDGQGRLLVGNDQGVWRSGGANKLNHSNNLKQIGLAAHNSASVEIIVTDAGGSVVGSYRLPSVTVTGTSGTFTLTFNGQTTGG